jgi:hypothetical protein
MSAWGVISRLCWLPMMYYCHIDSANTAEVGSAVRERVREHGGGCGAAGCEIRTEFYGTTVCNRAETRRRRAASNIDTNVTASRLHGHHTKRNNLLPMTVALRCSGLKRDDVRSYLPPRQSLMTVRWCASTPWRNCIWRSVMCFQAGMHIM